MKILAILILVFSISCSNDSNTEPEPQGLWLEMDSDCTYVLGYPTEHYAKLSTSHILIFEGISDCQNDTNIKATLSTIGAEYLSPQYRYTYGRYQNNVILFIDDP